MNNRLIVRGVREHNLKNIDLDLPRDAMIVFTGLSGSGKSSLAFDTIFAEGQRRYVESLSAYARQFLGQLDKPDVDAIEGLTPAVAIDQKGGSKNPRSTVGTITEIYDHLRLLWARVGQPHCPVCGEPIRKYTPQQIVDELLDQPEGARFYLLAPVAADQLDDLRNKGYARVRADGVVYRLDDEPALGEAAGSTVEVVVDRLVAKESSRARITDSVETALKLAGGVAIAELVDRPADDPGRELRFSEHLSCPNGHPLALDELAPKSFSFNSPLGACPVCEGLGTQMEADLGLVVPDGSKTLAGGAIAPWSSWQDREYFTRLLGAAADAGGFSLDTPWDELPEAAQEAVLHGTGQQVRVSYRTRSGRDRTYLVRFEGVLAWIARRYAEAESDSAREKFEGYMRATACPACGGARLRPEILAVTVAGQSIAAVTARPIRETADWVASLSSGPEYPGVLSERDERISARVRQEASMRLGFLIDVGLGYLSLDRPAATLAGGEAQRIRLATQIGSGLSGVLYVLDEPSIGLHQRDNEQLIGTLTRLRDLGNTLIVVEHDEDTIRQADWVVDIGPRAGREGGQVVFSGPVAELEDSPQSITGAYLSGRRRIEVPAQRRPRRAGHEIVVTGAREHNLRDIDVAFPLGTFTAVTGVSGSGKSSLVNDILYPALASQVNGLRRAPGRHTRVTGADRIDQVIGVDQSPIGRSPRSNPATYTGVFDAIRELFAETTAAKVRGYQPGRFSFNVKGGRCEHCAGEGVIRIEMNFLPDVYVPCEVCHGARYNRDTLEVGYKGKNIAEVLDMTIAEALEFFGPIQRIARRLAALVKVGLGYVRLGQPATTLSGGEAQRVKLAAELQRRSTGKTLYVLDEPTTGLHFEDVRSLLEVLHALVDKGNTVVVIEHNLDVIKTADWVIDLGPDAGPDGGTVVAEGTPEEVARVAASATGRFLARIFEKGATGPVPLAA
ncbi:MAG TPA: excinuclease ABC subunit UvrA [Streptosporangiaceae bacterium]|nr:excinuclease ABC subunit UvrA [Streptosporangiaceae bacterium]